MKVTGFWNSTFSSFHSDKKGKKQATPTDIKGR